MGILWESHQNGTYYSVRSAGGSVRLYSNGVFHSQWNPKRPFAGAVWDCLTLPALYQHPDKVKRVLLLGLGGGAGVRQLQTMLGFQKLVAIEIDPVHITIARDWFGVSASNIDVVEANAIDWVKSYRGAGFDLVIDDIFGHCNSEAMRAQPLTAEWLKNLKRSLRPDGTLVVNCISRRELRNALPNAKKAGFRRGFRWSLPEYDNAIGVFVQREVRGSDWSAHLDSTGLSRAVKRAARQVIRRPIDFG